jgi:hypothetical protein
MPNFCNDCRHFVPNEEWGMEQHKLHYACQLFSVRPASIDFPKVSRWRRLLNPKIESQYSAIGEACSKLTSTQLEQVVEVLNVIKDLNPQEISEWKQRSSH